MENASVFDLLFIPANNRGLADRVPDCGRGVRGVQHRLPPLRVWGGAALEHLLGDGGGGGGREQENRGGGGGAEGKQKQPGKG